MSTIQKLANIIYNQTNYTAQNRGYTYTELSILQAHLIK